MASAEIRAYLEEHKVAEGLSLAVNKAANLKVPNPLKFIGEELIKMSSEEKPLNILLQEDLLIRGGAQLWLMNCGSRLRAAGHNVTFLLPSASLIIEDCEKIEGVKVVTYDADKIAASPAEFKPLFTELLTPAQVCVTLVRQQRGEFQNVSFMGECIKEANLKTFLIAKTGTPDPSYKTAFYGGPLLEAGQCCVITIAQYTKDFIVEHMGVPAALITNVYNGTDTTKFKRTPEMAEECLKRYPCATPENAYVVGASARTAPHTLTESQPGRGPLTPVAPGP